MSQQKFFSGLTPGMMNRSAGVDRQKSSLFWSTEDDNDGESNNSETYGQRNNKKSVVQNGEHNNTSRRHSNSYNQNSNQNNQNNQNNQIDDVEIEKMDNLRKSRHENQLHSNFEFNDDAVDNEFTSLGYPRHNEMKLRNTTRNEDFRHYSRQNSGESEELSPRKQNVSSIKFYDFDESANNRNNDSNARVPRNGDYHTTSSRYTGSYVYDEESPSRRNRAYSVPEVVHQEPRSPPNPHRHLQSSINFSDGSVIGQDVYKKSVSVRDSAVKRVGVGLPNM